MIKSSGPEEQPFARAHAGDLIQITACNHLDGHRPECIGREWRAPVRLVSDPAPCPDGCGGLCCNGLDAFGHTIPVHAAQTRQVRVLEHGPTRRTA